MDRLDYNRATPAAMKTIESVYTHIMHSSLLKTPYELTIAIGLTNTYKHMAISFRTIAVSVE